jgi:hypothetical protein
MVFDEETKFANRFFRNLFVFIIKIIIIIIINILKSFYFRLIKNLFLSKLMASFIPKKEKKEKKTKKIKIP